MKPDILPGDLVEVEPLQASVFDPGIVIATVQANEVPDAHIRGLSNVYPWSYWIFFPEHSRQRGVRGPFLRSQIARARS